MQFNLKWTCLNVSLNDSLRLGLRKQYLWSSEKDQRWLCFSVRPEAAFNPHSSESVAVDGNYSSRGSLHHVSTALDIWMVQK